MVLTKQRFLLFIFGCILTRVIFVIIAKYINIKYLDILEYEYCINTNNELVHKFK